jgi:hypothetical protein
LINPHQNIVNEFSNKILNRNLVSKKSATNEGSTKGSSMGPSGSISNGGSAKMFVNGGASYRPFKRKTSNSAEQRHTDKIYTMSKIKSGSLADSPLTPTASSLEACHI